MNFTERYIKMCEKAKEIQKEWKHEADDYFAVPKEYWYWIDYDEVGNYAVYIISRYETDSGIYGPNPDIFDEERDTCILDFSYIRKHAIWLPTQEQLQEMVYEGGHPGYLLDKFVWWVIDYEKYRYSGEISYPSLEDFVCRDFSSMNELWLAFVMWEKYHKVWDEEKEEWRKI